MTCASMKVGTRERLASIDAMRFLMTVLVVFHHSAITYGAIGGWFYREVPTDGRLETKLLILFCSVNQAFFMSAFFLLTGAFTPPALARYGPRGFVLERLKRLGLPILAFALLLGPLTNAMAAVARGRSFQRAFLRPFLEMRFEPGPLWFAWALLLFSAGYLIVHAVWPRQDAIAAPRPFPSNKVLHAAAIATGCGAFLLRLVWPVGVNVAALQLGYFASYIVLFAAGCAASGTDWLTNVPGKQRRVWQTVAWITLPSLPIVALSGPHVRVLAGDTAGGWSVPAVVYAFWEPFLAWGIILWLLATLARAQWPHRPIWRAAARRSYAVYIIHPPILVGVALAWRGVDASHAVKFAVTGAVACALCYGLAGLLLRVPVIARIV